MTAIAGKIQNGDNGLPDEGGGRTGHAEALSSTFGTGGLTHLFGEATKKKVRFALYTNLFT